MTEAIPRILVAMIGARRHYAVPRIFAMVGWLERFYTDYFVVERWPSVFQWPIWPAWLRKAAARRAPEIPRKQVRHFPLFAVNRAQHQLRIHSASERLQAYAYWNHRFGELVCRSNWGEPNAVYVFNAAGLEILRKAKDAGLTCFLDQTTLPWDTEQAIVAEERVRWPGWEEGAVDKSDWHELDVRERGEWALADLIFCGSEWVRDAMTKFGVPSSRCAVVPYGVALSRSSMPPKKISHGPLHVLFVGSIELRKGIPYLLHAAEQIPSREAIFRAVGPVRIAADAARKIATRIELTGPLPRSELAEQYAWADVLVLPSLSEGSANVGYEALANGVPVITTPAAGSVVRDGIEGYIVPVRDANAIAERLRYLSADRKALRDMAAAAKLHAQEFTVEHYAKRLTAVVAECYRQRNIVSQT